MKQRQRLGVTFERFQMDDGRDLMQDISERIEPNGYIEFLYDSLPVKNNAHQTTRAGFEAACRTRPLDTHRIVSLDLLAPHDLFESADAFCQVFGPNSPAMPGFDADYLFYMPQHGIARDILKLMNRGKTVPRSILLERLKQLLEAFPFRILEKRGAYSLFVRDDLKFERLKQRQGIITVDDIDACYTWLVWLEDPLASENPSTETPVEQTIAQWLVQYRTTFVHL